MWYNCILGFSSASCGLQPNLIFLAFGFRGPYQKCNFSFQGLAVTWKNAIDYETQDTYILLWFLPTEQHPIIKPAVWHTNQALFSLCLIPHSPWRHWLQHVLQHTNNFNKLCRWTLKAALCCACANSWCWAAGWLNHGVGLHNMAKTAAVKGARNSYSFNPVSI